MVGEQVGYVIPDAHGNSGCACKIIFCDRASRLFIVTAYKVRGHESLPCDRRECRRVDGALHAFPIAIIDEWSRE
jgi:hypothetical protein